MIVIMDKKNLLHHNEQTLKPGVNQVDVKWWKEAKKHPTIAKMIEAGTISEEHDPEDEQSATQEANDTLLKEMKIPQAKATIEKTFDEKLLKTWLENETRNQVKGAIKVQLEKLSTPLQERDRSAARQIDTGKGPEIVDLGTAKPNALDE